ncbi:MAG: histidine kinase [Oscillospiraceae bacterium]|nr:histidine kinase [Oscillospiraceae bacterium]
MNIQIAATMAIDISGILLLILLILPMFGQTMDRKMFAVASAGLLHIVARGETVLCAVIAQHDPADRSMHPYILLSLILDAVAILLIIICCILTDGDGKIRFFDRQTPISVSMSADLILPLLAALLVENVLVGVRCLGFALAVSILLCRERLRRASEQALSEKERVLNIRQAKLMSEQMQPHFIFNSLMSIQELCYTDGEKAAKCIEDFSGYLRGNIDALTSEELIPFSVELEHIGQYIALEQAGSERQFSVEYDFGVQDFMLPALTVQPIVENAVKHSALCRRDGKGKVVIRTEEAGRFVRITVSDNGSGGCTITEKQKRHQSIGLQNVRTRLETQCGGNISFSRNGSGTDAVITIPLEKH